MKLPATDIVPVSAFVYVTPEPRVKLPLIVRVEPPLTFADQAPDVLSKLRFPNVLPDTEVAGVKVELPLNIIVLAASKVATPNGVAALDVVLWI